MFNLLQKIQRFVHLGPQIAAHILYARVKKASFAYVYRYKALQGKASITWQELSGMYPQLSQPHKQSMQKPLDIVRMIMQESPNLILEKADALLRGTFFLFGREVQLPLFLIEIYHQDFFCDYHDNQFDSYQWYADIIIPVGQSDQLVKDIRVPWELSRFSFSWQLAYAFKHTQDEKYANHLIHLIQHWIKTNPYLLGINWVCPMEVAIRALNWIIALDLLADSDVLTNQFWQQIVCSLYDHMRYLEHNWEWYDGRTSNHYLSNIVGYLVLSNFFDEQKNSRWAFKQLCAEFDKQVFDEGTNYEGSTAYHCLVTELFLYGFALALNMQLPVLVTHMQKLQRMFAFVDWCTPYHGKLITIGDDDSSVAVTGLTDVVCKNAQLLFLTATDIDAKKITYKNFGIAIIKTDLWHVSLRYHAYHNRQPSGHFHSDALSITLAYNGIPIFVDPGSYVYSASVVWRNHFRNVQAHNTFFIPGIDPIPLSNNLFTIAIPENHIQIADEAQLSMRAYHNFYVAYGLQAHRFVQLEASENRLIIEDSWQELHSMPRPDLINVWHFRLAPELHVEQLNDTQVIIVHNDVKLRCTTEINVRLTHDLVATGYGHQKSCYMFVIQETLISNMPRTIYIEVV